MVESDTALQPTHDIMAKKDTLGQDAEGRYRRYIGWKPGNGKLVQHLFRMGRDEQQAKAANLRLEQLWDAVAARWKRLSADGRTDAPCPIWDEVTLAIGQAIAKGQTTCILSPPADAGNIPPSALVTWLAVQQTEFPMIGLKLPGEVFDRGREGLREMEEIADDSKKLTQRLRWVLGETCGKTLHQALDAYAAYIEEKYKDKPSNRPQQAAITLLKKHQEDFALGKIDADKIETWLAYWCRRPTRQESGNPLAFTTCRNTLIVLRQFIRWLNRSSQFAWNIPKDFTFPRCKIAKTPQDRGEKAAALQAR